MTKDIQKTALRLPRELHTAILDAASKSGRTMNAEIVYRLQQSLDEGRAETISNIGRMEFRIVDPSIGKGPQKIYSALEEMEKILTGTLKMLEEEEHDEDGENHKG